MGEHGQTNPYQKAVIQDEGGRWGPRIQSLAMTIFCTVLKSI